MRSDLTLLQFLLSDRKNKLIETQVRVCVVEGYSFYRLLEQICFQTFSETILFSGLRAGKAYSNIQSVLGAEREEIRREREGGERERGGGGEREGGRGETEREEREGGVERGRAERGRERERGERRRERERRQRERRAGERDRGGEDEREREREGGRA